MSQFDDDDSKPWTDHDLKEAIRRINAGEINFKEAEDYYGISPRTIHRQRAIENMRAQLNPEKAKKAKTNPPSSTKKDVSVLRKPVDISCSSVNDIVALLDTGTEEVKQLLNYECDLIYECKVCKNLFRSLVNFISHKRVYCCDMYSVLHTRTDEGEDGIETSELSKDDKMKSKENLKEFNAKPFRITCRKDLTSVLKRITAMTELGPAEPLLHIESMESTSNAYQQTLVNRKSSVANESLKSTPEPPENVETSPAAESKSETSPAVLKIPEKSAVATKSSSYFAEKRFRCPICGANFTIKKSVMRHLKAVHNQSVEQIDRLRPRIQMHYVRKKSTTSDNKSPPEGKPVSTANKSKSENVCPDKKKNHWEKSCIFCSRLFINRNSYAAHIRGCKKRSIPAELDAESSASSFSKKSSLQPIVSLTPLASPSKSEPIDSAISTTRDSSKKLISATASTVTSKKVTLPLSASSSGCKKIGIQVRMNYDKANANTVASSSINGGSSGGIPSSLPFPSTPLSIATSSSTQSSANNSRRSSFATPKDNSSTDDVVNGHHTRSSSVNGGSIIANILETLLDKQHRTNESSRIMSTTTSPSTEQVSTIFKEKSAQGNVSSSANTFKKLPKNEVSVFCENCRSSFSLSEFKCNCSSGNGDVSSTTTRNFRCALRNCDFKCNDKCQLLPHLTAKHPILSEIELAEVDSTFIAETISGQSGNLSDQNKKKLFVNPISTNDKTDEKVIRKGAVGPGKVVTSECASSRKSASSSLLSTQLKRKLTSSLPSAKRRPLNVRQSSTVDNGLQSIIKNESSTKMVTPATMSATVPTTDVVPSVKRENVVGEGVTAPSKTLLHVIKKAKKVTKTPTDVKSKTFPRIKLLPTPNKPLVNGVASSSSDEENDLLAANAKHKMNCAGSGTGAGGSAVSTGTVGGGSRKQNLMAADMKPTKTPARVLNSHSELSSSSSTPDSDLDPSLLTEENLKKSIMTIIFGKDMPTGKMEDREKSPASSTDSSDNGTEKRYSVRIAKQSTSAKNIVRAVDCKEDSKVTTKIALTNKIKATR